MKRLEKEKHMLHILKQGNCKLNKAILKNCDEHLIVTLCEIIYNIMKGNVEMNEKQKKQLEKYKKPLRLINHSILKKKSLNKRRAYLVNQSGGYIGPIAQLILSAIATPLINHAVDAFTKSEA